MQQGSISITAYSDDLPTQLELEIEDLALELQTEFRRLNLMFT